MMRIYFIAVLLVFSSCTDGIDRVEEPANLIPRDKMVNVLKELVKLEAHVQAEYVSVNQFHKVMVNSGDSLLESFEITLEEFDNSMNYYGSRQDEMMNIYSDALERLNKELADIQSE
jgi:hypothetical protein